LTLKVRSNALFNRKRVQKYCFFLNWPNIFEKKCKKSAFIPIFWRIWLLIPLFLFSFLPSLLHSFTPSFTHSFKRSMYSIKSVRSVLGTRSAVRGRTVLMSSILSDLPAP